jgi:hypothetical protein
MPLLPGAVSAQRLRSELHSRMWRSSPFVVSLGESTPSECEEFDVPARTQTLLDIDLLALTPLSLTGPRPAAR